MNYNEKLIFLSLVIKYFGSCFKKAMNDAKDSCIMAQSRWRDNGESDKNKDQRVSDTLFVYIYLINSEKLNSMN